MAHEVSATIGSGTVNQVRGILPPDQRGAIAGARGDRTGTQVMIGNPEDLVSVDAFAVSGITVGTTPVEIVNPGENPLPRTRQVTIQNLDATNDVFISHKSTDVPIEGFQLNAVGTNDPNASNRVTIPLMHNVSVWAASSGGTANIRMIFI